MKYRLKDQELQRKLDELSGGEFSKNLHLFDDEHFASGWGKNICFTQTEDENGEELEEPRTDKQPQFGVFFNANEVEAVPEYNPHSWNEWPEVTPPEGILMRFELYSPKEGEGTPEPIWRGCVTRDGHKLVTSELTRVTFDEGDTARFRPWEDE